MTAPSRRSTIRPFTPSREAPEALDERTVGRDILLDVIHARLRSAATTKNRSHTLIVGPRGSGKTHVIDVALHRLCSDADLRGKVHVARVDEDAVGIVGYVDLLREFLRSSAQPYDLATTWETTRSPAVLEKEILDRLEGRVLVAVIENLSQVFDHLGTAGQRDLRSFVETTGQVVLLASTPLLFRGIGSRDEPWFGSFAMEHLTDLTLDQGIELMRRLARRDDNGDFVEFLDQPKGRARLTALHHLAGGSPRLWMILAGCATVNILDELVPAVEELLEELVPYYQQRLWALPGNEQKLVRVLGVGPPSASVADIATACGLDERTAATALGRLAENGWVRGEKLRGADQRKTWYRLREPLLRHHFQYRQTDGAPLRLIIDILRLWFDPSERLAHLATVRPTSVAERHLAATLSLDPPGRSDAPYADRDVDRLLGEARRWINEPGGLGTPEAGVVIEAVIEAVRESSAAARQAMKERRVNARLRDGVEDVLAAIDADDTTATDEHRVGQALDHLAAAFEHAPEYSVLELVAACWNGHQNEARAVDRLRALIEEGRVDRLGLTIRDEYGYWLGHAGCVEDAIAVVDAVTRDRDRVLGSDHPDTLVSRHNHAYELGELGRHEEAAAAFAALVADRARVLGADHRDTLATRHSHAYQLGELGRHEEAAAAFAKLVADRARVLGPDHRDTLGARHNHAYQLGELGRRKDAAAALAALTDDCDRVLGSDHPDTLVSRHNHAYELGELGRHEEAAAAFAALVADRARVLGADHRDTLVTRHSHAYQLGELGRHEEAAAAFAKLVADRARVLGPDHRDTLAARFGHAYELGELGRHEEAAAAFEALVEDRTRVLGPDHPSVGNAFGGLVDELQCLGRHQDAVRVAVTAVDRVVAVHDIGSASAQRMLTVLVGVLVGRLTSGLPLPSPEQLGSVTSTSVYRMLLDMEAARDGSVEAAARLPAELRALVEDTGSGENPPPA